MHFSKLSRSELLGVIAAALLVIALLFLTWYEIAPTQARTAGDTDAFICGVDQYSCTGWETFPIMRWLLLAVAIAPPILAYIVIRGHKLSWAPGRADDGPGLHRLRPDRLQRDHRPARRQIAEIGISKQIGYYVALLASAGIAAAGIGRSMEAQKGQGVRKTPGTV